MDLIQRLRADAADHKHVAGHADCRPEDTANWRHALNCQEAASKLEELLRWKGTHAPRIEALEYLLAAAQQEAAAGREAITSLASERAANELLTNEVERLRADVAAERDCRTCRNFRGTQHCHSVLRCVDGSSYKRGGVVQLWETAPVEPAPF